MSFKYNEAPKYLILQEEFGMKDNPNFNLVKLASWSLLLVALTYGLLLF